MCRLPGGRRGPSLSLPLVVGLVLAAECGPISRESRAAPPPPPGGHHPLTFGGYNGLVYPVVTVVDAGPRVSPPALRVRVAPNPFRSATTLSIQAREGEEVRIGIFSPDGRRLFHARRQAGAGGSLVVAWNARDDRGKALPAGLYLYQVRSGSRVSGGRLLLVR